MNRLKRFLALLLLGLVLIFIQGTVLYTLLPQYFMPNLLALVVVYLGLYDCSARGALAVFFLGLLADLYGGLLLGPWAGAFVLVYILLVISSQRIVVQSLLVGVVVSVVAVFLSSTLYLLLFFKFEVALIPDRLWHLTTEALMSGLCAPFFLPLLRRWLPVGAKPGLGRSDRALL